MSATTPSRDELLEALAAIRAGQHALMDLTECEYQDEVLGCIYDRLTRSWFPDDDLPEVEDGSDDEPWHRNPATVETYARGDELRAEILKGFLDWQASESEEARQAYQLTKMAAVYRERGTINIPFGEAVAS